jgi:hypothetical protein
VLVPLRQVWATLNGPTGKRLAPFMAEIVAALERAGELEVDQVVRDKLLRVSAATISAMKGARRLPVGPLSVAHTCRRGTNTSSP